MKVWTTTYALTKGILEVEDAESYFEVPSMVRWQDDSGWYLYARSTHWHRTREAAVAKANAMRTARIASLKKNIATLEKLRFE